MLDQALLGEFADDSELEEALRELDTSWYIGRETEAGWAAALAKGKENLFSLGHNIAQVSDSFNFQPHCPCHNIAQFEKN